MSQSTEKVAIVTGAAHGIGLATARLLLENKYRVAIWDVNPDELNRLPQQLKADADRYLTFPCDVSAETDVQRGIAQTLERFGRIDVLVNNAGVMDEKPLEEVTLADWNRVLGTNLTGAFLGAKYAAAELAKHRGSIINIASTRAFQSEPDTFAYSATKGALVALTHSLAISLGPTVRVNSISPGWIDVPDGPQTLRKKDHAQHPAGRVGTPDDIARMVLFLTDPQNDFVTGQNFVVDGGMTRKMIYVH
ncbi:SDR family oxidoreductase [Rudanella paleaurantiibacter]|uniref:SDR family oxidoreductase n=1 Tax=Rudanella paleaurantiibacter TaxID=2614655 RepID=A0A7J5TY83_9BACT|nr:SDR family oxidoreductase [Rudanella paleaurantiibacter]KAB7730092.1 SDR family oxidoreductase [Rudanella paleaurantiibacter]